MKKTMVCVLLMAVCALSLFACKKEPAPIEPSSPAPKNVTVTFRYDDGRDPHTVSLLAGERVTEPAVPTRTGCEFAGWYLGDVPYNFMASVTADMTLLAKWKADVEWVVSDGAEYQSEGGLPETVMLGETVRFTLKVAGTTSLPIVFVGETALTPDANGQYSFVVTGPTRVRISDYMYNPGDGTIDLPIVPLD